MKGNKRKNKAKNDLKTRIIKSKTAEIESLKKSISELQIDCEKKDELIDSIDSLRKDMESIVSDIDESREKYDRLVSELIEMRDAMNHVVFDGKWKLIRWLLK